MTDLMLFLSSGARARYREDILRSMALPKNCDLQFRYPRKLVSNILWEQFLRKEGEIFGQKVLIAYLDRTNKFSEPSIIPCRFATLIKHCTEGDFIVLHMRVGGFVKKT